MSKIVETIGEACGTWPRSKRAALRGRALSCNVPMKRPGQPAELATAYVMLADPQLSYTSGATVAVTGGKPII